MVEKIEFYYRAYMNPTFEFQCFDFDNAYTLEHQEFKVLSHTPKGVWIQYWNLKGKKFVLKDGKKRFAHPTKEEATVALGYRLRSYIKHLRAKLEGAEMELEDYDMIVENK